MMSKGISIPGLIMITGTTMLLLISITFWLMNHIIWSSAKKVDGERIVVVSVPFKKLLATILLLGCQIIIITVMMITFVLNYMGKP